MTLRQPSQVDAHGLLAIDVLLRVDGGLEHARVLEGRRGDDHRVDGGVGQQLFEVLVDVRFLKAEGGSRLLDAVVEGVAEGGDAAAGIGVGDLGVEGAAPAAADEADRDFGVGLAAAHSGRGDDREGRGGRSDQAAAGECAVGGVHGPWARFYRRWLDEADSASPRRAASWESEWSRARR